MAFSNLTLLLLLFISYLLTQNSVMVAKAQVEDATTSLALEWPSTYSSYPSYPFGVESDEEDGNADGSTEDEHAGTKNSRRSLFWHRMKYYISYGALSADRTPCPARSGRSYYTHNCYRARGPVRPYRRGCSAITRCRR